MTKSLALLTCKFVHVGSTSGKYLLAITLILAGFGLKAQITSTFNLSAENWTTPNDADGTISYAAAGGNPGGLVAGSPFSFNLGAGTIYVPFNFVAPVAYRGNRSTYYNGTLRYDIQQSTSGAPNQYPEVTIANSGGLTLYYFPTVSNQPAAAPAWTTFSVTLNNALGFWKTTNSATGTAAPEAQVQSILADLAALEIRGLYRDANTTNRLDNVSFRPPIIINTQPASSTICNGVTTTLTTVASGNPTITYQWQLETSPTVWTNVTNTGGYSGATTASLSVNTTGNFGAGNYRCQISGLQVDNAFTSTATIAINALPAAPTTTGNSSCIAASLTLTAAGGAAGQYRWYTVPTGGTAIVGQTNNTYTTPVIGATTTYYAAINNGTCESLRTAVAATINTPPVAPTTTGNAACGASSLTLTAAGGAAGQYRWYSVPTGGTAIAGQTNNTYTTPVIGATTTYYAAINDGTCESTRSTVIATINTPPVAPTVTGSSSCTAASLTLTAAGGAAGQYRWYTVPAGGTAIAGEGNSTYTTLVLAITTTYYAAIHNGVCESTRTPVIATINPIPSKPIIVSSIASFGNNVSVCSTNVLTLSAPSGFNTYTWLPGGNTQQITPSVSGNYSVVVTNSAGCSSVASDVLTVTVIPAPCSNQAPVITATSGTTQIEGKVTLDLVSLITDADNNIDLQSLKIKIQPTSGARATITANRSLELDYFGIAFLGTDVLTIEVCDLSGDCTQQEIKIEVIGDLNIYTGISPNGDGLNDFLIIQYIDVIAETKDNMVSVYNRWGDVVFETENYNNQDRVFKGLNKSGNELPSGTYFYKIEFSSGRKTQTGYLAVKK